MGYFGVEDDRLHDNTGAGSHAWESEAGRTPRLADAS
jgi:hypothetical protein